MNVPLLATDLSPGTTFCLHIPRGLDYVEGEVIETQILQLASRHGKVAAIARPAQIDRHNDEHASKQSSVNWLSRTAGTSEEQACKIIAGLGVEVADRLASNAGTPRSLLGIAAALVRKPEVLIYTARAIDREGCWAVHKLAQSNCKDMCVVHVSYPHVYGDGSSHPRDCPKGARCILLE